MKGYKDFSVALARSLVLRTPPPLRATRKGRNPWNKTAQRKNDLLKKLAKGEQKHDFYSRLYSALGPRIPDKSTSPDDRTASCRATGP